MTVKLEIPFEVIYILHKLSSAGFDAYLVGGSVRDLLLRSFAQLQNKENALTINDFDFTTNAAPSQIQQLFSDSYYTNEFGMVGIAYRSLIAEMIKQGYNLPSENIQTRTAAAKKPEYSSIIDLARASKIHQSLQKQVDAYEEARQDHKINPPPFEITTYRSEGIYSDHRHPDRINWGKTVEEDLKRRDFTINAMALSITKSCLKQILKETNIKNSLISVDPDDYTLVDEHHGLKDLAKKLIITVGNPDQRFNEDALRMLRAVRLACQLEFEIEALTLAAIKHNSHLISKISWERIREEFLKILVSDQPDRGIKLLDETGLLGHIMPELLKAKGVEQGGHHDTDVWTHALGAVKHCPSYDPVVRLAALLHDIGKPAAFELKNGEITFYNHEIISSRIADKIAKRFKLSTEQRERLFNLIRHHMFYYQPHHTDAAIRRLIKRVGLAHIDDILALREGDRLGSGARKTSWRLEELKQRIVEQLNQPLDVTDLAVDGHDLMQNLDLKPGPRIGEVLDQLLEKVLEDPELNNKEKLLKLAKKIPS